MKKLIFFLPLLGLLVGCISVPKGLEANEFTIQDLSKIQAEDYNCQCKQVRLGGKILSVTALKDKMKLEILSQPIAQFSVKPVLDALSNGRFIAYLNGFIDPETLKNQYITVRGYLTNTEKSRIDQAEYSYPVVQVEQYKRWRLAEEYYYEADDWWDYWGYRRYGFYPFRPEPQLRYRLY